MKFPELKRTNMIDEAAFKHKPITILKAILIFVLVSLIAKAISSTIYTLPASISIILSEEYTALTDRLSSGAITVEEYMQSITELEINIPWWTNYLYLFSGGALIAVAIFYCKKFEKRSVRSMGLRGKKSALCEGLLGALVGFLLMGATVLLLTLFGKASISFNNGIKPFWFIVTLVGVALTSLGKELLLRGYFLTSLARDWKPTVALTSCVLVTVLYELLFEGGFTLVSFINFVLLTLLLCLLVLRRGSIIGAVSLHAMYIFTERCIFGPPSEVGFYQTLFNVNYDTSSIIVGKDALGVSESILLTPFLLVAILLLALSKTNKKEESPIKIEYFE